MKFFKHFVDGHESPAMAKIIRDFGMEGYGAYFLIMEMVVKKIEKDDNAELTEEHCRVRLDAPTVRQRLRMKPAKVERLLSAYSVAGLLTATAVGDELTVFIPKVLKFFDRDSARARKLRAQSAPKKKIEERERDKEKEREEELGKSPAATTAARVNLFPINQSLKGDVVLDEVLPFISAKTQERWLKKYPADWLRQTLSRAVEHHLTKADCNPDAVKDWGLKLTNWLGRERNPPTLSNDPLDIDFDEPEPVEASA